ncbi:MAG TPA: cupin domain-containing protein [Bdellovibrionota bacterium]|nr:cupin domain-containing protein [Bdellovibrionota bacterium]
MLIDIPKSLPSPENAVEWALSICQEDRALIGTAMRRVFKDGKDDDDAMIYASRGNANAKTRAALISGVRKKLAVQLQTDFLEKKAPEFGKYIKRAFHSAWSMAYPFGYDPGISLFVTGSDHVYDAHCDVGDGILLQFHGRKIVKLWGPTQKFYEKVIFDHDFRGKPELFESPIATYELIAGQGIYLPRGAMHEISVRGGEISVSVGIRPESIYPVMTLCTELCEMAGVKDAFSVVPGCNDWSKFLAKMFNPTDFKRYLGSRTMPPALRQNLLTVLQPKSEKLSERLAQLLDRWWQKFCRRRKPSPTGPLPARPIDREAILKQWEDERYRAREQKRG